MMISGSLRCLRKIICNNGPPYHESNGRAERAIATTEKKNVEKARMTVKNVLGTPEFDTHP